MRKERVGKGREREILAVVLALAVMIPATSGRTADRADPDWPCIQRLMPELSAATVWDGPAIEGSLKSWQDRLAVRELVSRVAARRTTLDEAEKSISTFARTLEVDKEATLTAVFAGVFATINGDRAQLIAGIKRYARNQRLLADKIRGLTAEMEALRVKGTPESEARRQQLHEQWAWDTRIHDEREKSLKAVCDQPVLLEQRLFVLTRAIRAELSQ